MVWHARFCFKSLGVAAVIIFMIIIADWFCQYNAILSALEQIHRSLVACDSE